MDIFVIVSTQYHRGFTIYFKHFRRYMSICRFVSSFGIFFLWFSHFRYKSLQTQRQHTKLNRGEETGERKRNQREINMNEFAQYFKTEWIFRPERLAMKIPFLFGHATITEHEEMAIASKRAIEMRESQSMFMSPVKCKKCEINANSFFFRGILASQIQMVWKVCAGRSACVCMYLCECVEWFGYR